jgi:hypothetical protein
MKTKASWLFVLAVSLVASFFSACNDDNDDDGQHYLRLGVINGTSTSYNIILDNKDIIYPENAITSSFITDGKRVIVDYTIQSNMNVSGTNSYKVKVYYIDEVLTKSPVTLTRANADSIGNDPLYVNSMWSAGKYLNINFSLYYGNAGIKHLMNLAIDTVQTSNDTISLIFTQNAHKDAVIYGGSGLISFDMSSLLGSKKTINLSIKAKNYEGITKRYNLPYSTDSTISISGTVLKSTLNIAR